VPSSVLSEEGVDLNGDGIASDDCTGAQYRAAIDAQTALVEAPLNPPDVPSRNEEIFHSSYQDDWHNDQNIGVSGAKYLHICGFQMQNATTLKVTAKPTISVAYDPLSPLQFTLTSGTLFDQALGEGDGVVPLLSAQRQPHSTNPNEFLNPNTMERVVPGKNDDVEHVALMYNQTVWNMIGAFLKDQLVPDTLLSFATSAETAGTVATQHIVITGSGYVPIQDSLGNQNTQYTDIAAKKIPNLDITYGGDDPWININAPSDVDFTIHGGASNHAIEVNALQLAQDGTVLSLRRYRFDATGHAWQVHISATMGKPVVDPVVGVDTNDSGTYEAGELISPSHSSGTGPVDTTSPTLDAVFSMGMNTVLVQLTAHDDMTANPAIHYTINDGQIEDYSTLLSFPSNGSVVLKAFAEDAMGNTSALLTTTPIIGTTLGNISTRLRVEAGDNVLIGGFIITGTDPKRVIVRAIGPSLPFADELADPFLELHDSSGALLEANDNWVDSPNKQAIIDSTIPPGHDLESAIIRSLPPGSYTAIVRGTNNETGIGVVEAYDLDPTANSKLANISTRGLVQTGDNVLIAGTIVVGQASQKVLIRALGPSVPVAGNLADPTLELHDVNGALLEANDNWVDSPNKQAIIDSTIPPPNDMESAIVRTLTPANYTAIVRGVGDATGIAVVEIYALN
jgi:hypothetical protein